MTYLVAVLDQFARPQLVRDILQRVLKSLLKLHEYGEDVLRSQYSSRLNAWRSTSALRGINQAANEYRQEMIRDGHVLSGWLPQPESRHVEDFLVWFLGSQEPIFNTPSSDVAGMAACLARLGFDILDVESVEHLGTGRGPCTVIYSAQPFLHNMIPSVEGAKAIASRDPSITVPLQRPWEAVRVFPVTKDVQKKCIVAWKRGQKAAKALKVYVQGEDVKGGHYRVPFGGQDAVTYHVISTESPAAGCSGEFLGLVRGFGLYTNFELIKQLQRCLGSTPPSVLSWILATTNFELSEGDIPVSFPNMDDQRKLEAFCVFQSFFMGYYYDIFGRLVETSSLTSQTVEGSWGFRSPDFLRYMRKFRRMVGLPGVRGRAYFRRSHVIALLSMLFLGGQATNYEAKEADESFKGIQCLGIVGKRTLVANSLLGKCASPQQLGRFTLLDVDVGGIPRDFNGLIKPGILPPEFPLQNHVGPYARHDISEVSPGEDVTFHIEADWEADPETVLLCVRHRGRRVACISPFFADRLFCRAFVPPGKKNDTQGSSSRSKISGIEAGISNLTQDEPVLPYSSAGSRCPVLFQALDCPRLRYAACALYGERVNVKVATDCVENARLKPFTGPRRRSGVDVVVGGMTELSMGDISIRQKAVPYFLYEIK